MTPRASRARTWDRPTAGRRKTEELRVKTAQHLPTPTHPHVTHHKHERSGAVFHHDQAGRRAYHARDIDDSSHRLTFLLHPLCVPQVQRGLVGEIIGRFERRGYQLVALKLVHASREHIEKHYADLAGKPFFPGLVE